MHVCIITSVECLYSQWFISARLQQGVVMQEGVVMLLSINIAHGSYIRGEEKVQNVLKNLE